LAVLPATASSLPAPVASLVFKWARLGLAWPNSVLRSGLLARKVEGWNRALGVGPVAERGDASPGGNQRLRRACVLLDTGGGEGGRPLSQPKRALVAAELDWLDDWQSPLYADACQIAAQQVVQASEQSAFSISGKMASTKEIVMISLQSAALGHGRLAPTVCDAISLRRA
jgi:hypothetical protein